MGAFEGTAHIKRGRSLSRTVLYLFLLIAAVPAGASPDENTTPRARSKNHPGKNLVIWALSDVQPGNISERWHFETAVKDMRDHLPGVSIALAAGDMLHRSSSESDWDWFMRTRALSGIPFWFEIAGNHESRNLQYYRKRTGKPLHYAVAVGNLLILCMSDEGRGPDSIISSPTFQWWKRVVTENREKIIITMTHAPLKRSDLAYTLFPSMIIRDSERFFTVLQNHRVDLWISGHAHHPYFFGGKNSVPAGTRGTLFINVSSVKRDFPFDPIESGVIYFTAGSRTLLVRTRDHVRGSFVKTRDIIHETERPFTWDGSPPRMLP